MTQKLKLSFAIPVFRNGPSLRKLYENIRDLFEKDLTEYDFEIVFTDDGSDDDSLSELLNLRSEDRRVKVITFTRNFGQMAAILSSLQHCTGDAVVNMSADLQEPIETVIKLVAAWRNGSELVIAYREKRQDDMRAAITSRIAYKLLRLTYSQIPKGGFDFYLMDKKVLKEFNSIETRNRYLQGDLLWLGFKMSLVPYTRKAREFGKSQYNFWKRLKNFVDAFLDSSYLPVRFISVCGMLTSLLGGIYSITVVYSYFSDETPFTGWAPLMMTILIVGGMLMFMLGIIGEYIWRIYDEVKRKPNFVTREMYLDD